MDDPCIPTADKLLIILKWLKLWWAPFCRSYYTHWRVPLGLLRQSGWRMVGQSLGPPDKMIFPSGATSPFSIWGYRERPYPTMWLADTLCVSSSGPKGIFRLKHLFTSTNSQPQSLELISANRTIGVKQVRASSVCLPLCCCCVCDTHTPPDNPYGRACMLAV